MSKQFKSLPFAHIKATEDETKNRIRKGICAVFGNVDSIGDRIHLGAFAKTISENLKSVKHLWNHDYWNPPIASIVDLKELTRDELPGEVLAKAPDATGGLMVARKYYEGNPLSDWILKAIDAGDINEMSFAYDVIKYEITEEETGFEDMPKRRIRELRELKLFDTSDVNWGCNGATVAVGAKRGDNMPLGLIYSNLLAISDELKAGRRNSDSDQQMLDLIHSKVVDLGAKCSTEQTDEPKSIQQEKPEEKAEAVEDTSLGQDWLDLQKLELESLGFRQID